MNKTVLVMFLLLANLISFGQNGNLVDSTSNRTFAPSITLQNPLSPGTLGLIVLGISVQNKTRLGNNPDANAGMYVGLGDPKKFIGAGITLNVYGLSNKIGERKNLGSGAANIHFNKYILHDNLLVDVGIDNALLWGNYIDKKYISYQRSFYFSSNYTLYTSSKKTADPFSYISITAGVGNGYYRSDKHYTNNGSGSFDPFVSLATPLLKSTNLITEWNGYDFGAGLSAIPFQKVPFMFQLEITDLLFGNPRVVSAVSFPFTFKRSSSKAFKPIQPKAIRPARTI